MRLEMSAGCGLPVLADARQLSALRPCRGAVQGDEHLCKHCIAPGDRRFELRHVVALVVMNPGWAPSQR